LAESTNYHPVKFLDQLEGNKHVVMLYDDESYGNMMIARYFLNGLKKGESCIYFTDEENVKPIEGRLRAQGLDLEKYEQANRFRIYRTHLPSNPDAPIMEILKTISTEAVKGMKRPYRFAGRTIMDIESTGGMLRGMEVEKTGQSHFSEFDNAQMCFYDVRKLEQSRKKEWIRGLLQNHDQVYYASSPEKAVAFDTEILEEDE
jgi:hypothetical protein